MFGINEGVSSKKMIKLNVGACPNYARSLIKDDEFLRRHKAIIKAIDKLESK